MSSFEFAWENNFRPQNNLRYYTEDGGLSSEVLLQNAAWFIKLRWFIISFLLVAQFSSVLIKEKLLFVGILPIGWWALSMAIFLSFSNFIFLRVFPKQGYDSLLSPFVHIWIQIINDLICLGIVVHFVGSVGTPAPFLYLLHISISCVFFTLRSSFLVALFAATSYCICIGAEGFGIITSKSILANISTMSQMRHFWTVIPQVFASLILFFLIWYVVSQLSITIRTREKELLEAETKTRMAQDEKDRYAVQMTHQLKSPLDAIRSFIGLILGGYSGKISDEVTDLIKQIDFRAKGLSQLIMDVLKLTRLKSNMYSAPFRPLNLGNVLLDCIVDIQPLAKKNNITIDSNISDVCANCIPDQIKMLFENLLSNAIIYSKKNGKVSVTCELNQDMLPKIVIMDEGIGISPDKLPHIFEDYFRTKEAANHNSASTGIGLAIVKRIAQIQGLKLIVESDINKGCKVNVIFPEQCGVPNTNPHSTIEFNLKK